MSTTTKETYVPVLRDYQVSLILNGREINLATFRAFSKDDAVDRCKREIMHAEDFKLFAKETGA